MPLSEVSQVLKGGKGSGDFGHGGRPGKRGGSAPGTGKGLKRGTKVSFMTVVRGKLATLHGDFVEYPFAHEKFAKVRAGGKTYAVQTNTVKRIDPSPNIAKGEPAINLVKLKPVLKPIEAKSVPKRISSKEMSKISKSWEDKLSDSEETLISEYSDGLFNVMNSNLRGVKAEIDPLGWDRRSSLRTVGGLDKGINGIDRILAKSPPLPRAIPVFRAMPEKFISDIGSVFSDKGFPSTSISKEAAKEFLSSTNIMAEIRLPKGTKGAFLKNFSLGSYEQEYLLPRNSKFKVVSRSKDGVILELI